LSAPNPELLRPAVKACSGDEDDERFGKYAESGSAGVPCSLIGVTLCCTLGTEGALAEIVGRELGRSVAPGREACPSA